MGTLARGSHGPRAGSSIALVCGLTVLAGAVLVGRAALADRYLNEGRDVLVSDPAAAVVKAKDSQRLNDERLQAYYLESAAWARLGDYPRARAALAEATRREPHDFVTWALLGDLATRRGEDRQALADYRRALALNPRDPSLEGSGAASTGAGEDRIGGTDARTSDNAGGAGRHLRCWWRRRRRTPSATSRSGVRSSSTAYLSSRPTSG